MKQEIVFPTMQARDAFMHQVNNNYCKDFYGLGKPVETIHILGWGSPSYPDSPNAKLASLDMSKVSDIKSVGQLMALFGGRIRG
ncbi:hypothetical protein [uncultured Alistipes sp.]|uniref:hypothetical protein n=1 Tax=uncultured Alistipes sp. TaxID=538949 RepID=UPI002729910E|nr:hypothetical protein [uncultured Alistipes sp.]